jgi:bleomycin hydrolase
MKRITATMLSLALCSTAAMAQNKGSITSEMLAKFRQTNVSSENKALGNALFATDINTLTRNAANPAAQNKYFSDYVKSKGITDQKSSGRCWLFTGLNVLRAKMIESYGLGEFKFSHVYCFFYDQLEKSNLFLQGIIDNAKKPMDDKMVEWLFKNPLSDGGQFTGIADLISKYGVVPSETMPETYAANSTSRMSQLLSYKLRQFGLELRDMAVKGAKNEAMQKRKTEMLGTVYHMLTLFLGTPPEKFTWTRTDKDGKPVSTKEYTPLGFYNEFVAKDLKNNYVMLMNDPTRPYYKVYEIDFDRHTYDGQNWTYLNLPMDSIKQVAIRSIKDSTMMYMSCDVGKFLDKATGLLDSANYDYASLLGTEFNMSKKERIMSFASMSSHAMTLMAVDLNADGKPVKWEVENSWGSDYGYNGHLIMTDAWLDGYLFRLVAEKKYISQPVLDMMNQKPIMLPAWDPMFSFEE